MRDLGCLQNSLSNRYPVTMRTRLAAKRGVASNALSAPRERGSEPLLVVQVVLDDGVQARIVDKSRKCSIKNSNETSSNAMAVKREGTRDESEPLSKMRKKNGRIPALKTETDRCMPSPKKRGPTSPAKSPSKKEKTFSNPNSALKKSSPKRDKVKSKPSLKELLRKTLLPRPMPKKMLPPKSDSKSAVPTKADLKAVSPKSDSKKGVSPKSDSKKGVSPKCESKKVVSPKSESKTTLLTPKSEKILSPHKASTKARKSNDSSTISVKNGNHSNLEVTTVKIEADDDDFTSEINYQSKEGQNKLTINEVGSRTKEDKVDENLNSNKSDDEVEEVNVDFLDEFEDDIIQQPNGSSKSDKLTSNKGKSQQEEEEQIDRLTIDESSSDKPDSTTTARTATPLAPTTDDSFPSRTVRVQTPVFLDKENVGEVVRSLSKAIDSSALRRVHLSHFFFMEFSDTVSCQQWRSDPDPEVANELTYYCAECAFAREAQVQEHWASCRSDDNRELNKFAKLFIYALPDFSHVTDRQVLVVRRFRSVALDELDKLFSGIQGLTNVTFARSLFIEMESRSAAAAAAKAINNTKLKGVSESNLPVVEAQLITHAPGYRALGVSDGQKEDKSAAIRSMRYTLAQTLFTHELRSDLSLAKQCVLMLGQSMRIVIKGSSNKYVEWIKRLLGPDCSRVVSGELANQEAGNKSGRIKNNPMADFSVYGVAFFSSQEAARLAIKNCQMHFLLKHHLNVLNLENFLSVLRPSSKKVPTVRAKQKKEKKMNATLSPSVDYRLSLEFGEAIGGSGSANSKTNADRGRARLFSADQ